MIKFTTKTKDKAWIKLLEELVGKTIKTVDLVNGMKYTQEGDRISEIRLHFTDGSHMEICAYQDVDSEYDGVMEVELTVE